YEGFSLPAAEAMATGTPLVATTGGAIPEVAGPDGETCLAVPPGDAGALAASLSRLLGDPDLRARLGSAGRARVLERFTWARAAQGTVAHYREAIARAAGSASPRATPRPASSAPRTTGSAADQAFGRGGSVAAGLSASVTDGHSAAPAPGDSVSPAGGHPVTPGAAPAGVVEEAAEAVVPNRESRASC
ncbi:glycosyltransferase family 4 protein, partial [Streptomyces sp. NPDC059466]